MSQPRSSRWGATLLLLAAIVGLALALYAYFTPLTGVNSTLGALVAIAANIIIALLALALRATSGGARIFWAIIALLGVIGTGFAGLLLHQWWITAAMVVGLIGVIGSFGCPVSHDKSAKA